MGPAPGAPLHDVKVLDLSRMAPGAFCTLLLADLGADVVKVEAPGAGDGLRGIVGPEGFGASHVALNRGKRSLALDLRNPAAAAVLRRLVGWADVVVESHRPGQLDRFGLGYEAMSTEQPALVWCSITGFGDFGPRADEPGHGLRGTRRVARIHPLRGEREVEVDPGAQPARLDRFAERAGRRAREGRRLEDDELALRDVVADVRGGRQDGPEVRVLRRGDRRRDADEDSIGGAG